MHIYTQEDLDEYKRAPDPSRSYAATRAQLAHALALRKEVIGLLHEALVLAYAEDKAEDLAELLSHHTGDCVCVWETMSVRAPLDTEYPCATHAVCDWIYRPSRRYHLEARDLIDVCVTLAECVFAK